MTMSKIATEVPRQKLKELVEKNGESLLQDPDRCEGLLKDHCGAHRREISAIVGALEERVPMELKSSWQTAMTPEAMRARLVQRLEDNRGLAPEIATWAVDTWSYALGVGLGRNSDRIQDVAGDGKAAAVAGIVAEKAAADGGADKLHGDVPMHVVEGGGGAGKNRIGSALNGLTPQKKKVAAGGVVFVAAAALAFGILHHSHPTQQTHTNTPSTGPQQQNPGGPPSSQANNDPNQPNGPNGPANPSGPNGPDQPAAPNGPNQPNASNGPSGPNGPNGPSNPNGQPAQNPQIASNRRDPNMPTTPGVVPQEPNSQMPSEPGQQPAILIAAGSSVVVRLDQEVNSDHANVGDILPATVVTPVTHDGNVIVPRGAVAQLKIVSIDKAGKVSGKARLQLELVELVAGGKRLRTYASSKSFEGPSQAVKTTERTGIGAGAGAVAGFLTGKLFHHGKAGAATGAVGGGVVGGVTTKPSPVKLSAETVIQFRLTKGVA